MGLACEGPPGAITAAVVEVVTIPTGPALPAPVFDKDGDGFATADCDDADPTVHPGADEQCDGRDQDCDLSIDEGAFLGWSYYPTVQSAVDAATAGSTVELCDGVIRESGIRVDRAVTITSMSRDRAATTIDGANTQGSVFLLDGADLVLEHLTIVGGSGTPSLFRAPNGEGFVEYRAGGAVTALTGAGGVVTVNNCLFQGNQADVGGAIAGTEVRIVDSAFVENVAVGGANCGGGAISVEGDGLLTVERTTFERNRGAFGGALTTHSPTVLVDVHARSNVAERSGGFLWMERDSFDAVGPPRLDVVRGVFELNTAAERGGALMVAGNSLVDDLTVFSGNTAGTDGGAVWVFSSHFDQTVTWSGGRFLGNVALEDGGALYVDAGWSFVDVVDVTVQGNTAFGYGGGAFAEADAGLEQAASIRDSQFEGNDAHTGGGIAGTTYSGFIIPENQHVHLSLDHVELRANTSTTGAALDLRMAWMATVECVLADNVAFDGGGLGIDDWSKYFAVDTDFAGNLPNDISTSHDISYVVSFQSDVHCDGWVCVCGPAGEDCDVAP